MREFYGAGPAHAAGAAFGLLIAFYGLWRIVEVLDPWQVLPWLLGAAIFHDLIFLPIYAGIGGAAYAIARLGLVDQPRVGLFNHIRIPALISGLLLVVWFPLIFELESDLYMRSTGLSTDVFMGRWLNLTAALFAISLLVYAGRMVHARMSESDSGD